MAKLIKPPTDVSTINGIVGSVFLAGSIEMGKAIDWQQKVWEGVKDIPALGVLNPRRDDWDNSWKQEKSDKHFYGQVTWELEGLENVDMVVYYFDPKTTSPVTMLELGLLSNKLTNFTPKTVVCCPEGFYRKGNIDIVCERYRHKMVDTLEDLIQEITKEFGYLSKLDKDFDSSNCSMGWNKGKNV